MSSHAGFAAVICVGQQTVQDLLDALYGAGKLSHTLKAALAPLDANLFLDAPILTLAASNGGKLELALRGWGPLGITLPGQSRTGRVALLSMRLLVTPAITLKSGQLTFGLDASTVTLEEITVDVLGGGPFPDDVAAYLQDDAFKLLVQLGLIVELGKIKVAPIRVGFLGDIVRAPGLVSTTTLLDGALAIGLDAHADDLTTAGDGAAIADFRDGDDLAIAINPAASLLAFASVRTQFAAEAKQQGATLDAFTATFEDGDIHFHGRASKTGGAVEFSFDATPQLERITASTTIVEETGTEVEPSRVLEELWFAISNLDVDVEVDWWARVFVEGLLGIITFGFYIGKVELEAETTGDSTRNQIRASENRREAAVVQEFSLAGVAAPTFRLRIQRYEVHADGVLAGATLRPQVRAAAVRGPTSLGIDQIMRAPVSYQVSLPYLALPSDPMLHVRWTVRRLDTGEAVVELDRVGPPSPKLSLDLRAPDRVGVTRWSIACRVYRALGAAAEELFDDTIELRIIDPLDRSHPFVRWSHFSNVPNVRVEDDGTHVLLGFENVERFSDIHRTAVPGRCWFAARFSLNGPRGAIDRGRPLEYLDALPFPHAEIVARRAVLCDYCFFGGPTKTVPLI